MTNSRRLSKRSRRQYSRLSASNEKADTLVWYFLFYFLLLLIISLPVYVSYKPELHLKHTHLSKNLLTCICFVYLYMFHISLHDIQPILIYQRIYQSNTLKKNVDSYGKNLFPIYKHSILHIIIYHSINYNKQSNIIYTDVYVILSLIKINMLPKK